MSSLYVQEIETGFRTNVVENVRNLKIVDAGSGSILFYENGELQEFDLTTNKRLPEIRQQVGVFTDANLALSVYQNGQARIINPNGPADYLWPSLSPDKKNILYSVSGKGTFISNLEGTEVVELGRLHAPKWSADGKYVIGMDDYDDGQRFTKSDIILVSSDGKARQNLTKDLDIIALYPTLSPDGTQIFFNDEKGMVYTMNVL